jgi:hypothetical protein
MSFSHQFSKNAAVEESFHQLMRQTFSQIADPKTPGSIAKYNYTKAEALRQQAVKGDLSWLPEVKVLSNSEFSKAQFNGQQPSSTGTVLGAFGDDTIMLNKSVLSDPGLALRIYAEEAGHALDKVLNQEVDSAGDEGAIFQKLLSGEKISVAQMQVLKAENDQGVLTGKNVEFILEPPSQIREFERLHMEIQAQQEAEIQRAIIEAAVSLAKYIQENELHFDASIYLEHPGIQKKYDWESTHHVAGGAHAFNNIHNHWVKEGIDQGIKASLEFDPKFYASKNPSVKEAFGNNYRAIFNHWQNHGIKGGLQGSDDFDISYYLSKYRDQIEAYAKSQPIVNYVPQPVKFQLNVAPVEAAKITNQVERDNYNAFAHWREVGRQKGLIGTLKSDIKVNIVAVAFKNAVDGLVGAEAQYNNLIKDGKINTAVTDEIYKVNASMSKEELKTAVANLDKANRKAYLLENIDRAIAVAASDATKEKVGIKEGAKADNVALLRSITNKDNRTISAVIERIVRRNSTLTFEQIDGLVSWHKGYAVKQKAAE